jgi:hypothetical protein
MKKIYISSKYIFHVWMIQAKLKTYLFNPNKFHWSLLMFDGPICHKKSIVHLEWEAKDKIRLKWVCNQSAPIGWLATCIRCSGLPKILLFRTFIIIFIDSLINNTSEFGTKTMLFK